MRGRAKALAVFDLEDGSRVEIDLWEKVFSLRERKEIYAYYAHPDFPVRVPLARNLQGLRDQRNYDRTTKIGVTE